MVAQFIEGICTTKTTTLPYRSILGTAKLLTFPSFNEGVLYKYYGTQPDCNDNTDLNVAGWYWSDLLCKTFSRSILNVCSEGTSTYQKYRSKKYYDSICYDNI